MALAQLSPRVRLSADLLSIRRSRMAFYGTIIQH